MISKVEVERIVNEALEGSSDYVVEVSVSENNHIVVLIESDEGINIKRCVQVSRLIEAHFDREVEDYDLEVSSAGLGSPLKVIRQYKKNIGREVAVTLLNNQSIKGKLEAVNETSFTVSYKEKELVEGSKRKQIVDKTIEIPFSEVKTTYIIISFR